MKTSFLFAITNIKRYPWRVLGRNVLLFLLTFVVVLSLMFSMSTTNLISGILNSRTSGNTLVVSTEESNLNDILKLPLVNEVIALPFKSFTSGEITVDNIGTFQINCEIIKANNINSLLPQTYLQEFSDMSDDDLILAGRLPMKSKEIIVDSGYIDKLQIYDYNQIVGKTISVFHRYFDEVVYDVQNAIVVGVYSKYLLDITALSSFSDSACCFLMDESLTYSGKLVAYCNPENISEAEKSLQQCYGTENVVKTTKTTIPLNELINISSFVNNVIGLVCIVVCAVYIFVQTIAVTRYLREKSDFIVAVNAVGLNNKKMITVFIFEYLMASILPFVFASVLATVCTKVISRYVAIISGIGYAVETSLFPVLISFVIVTVVSLLTIVFAVCLRKPDKNG